jgi:hypothetical protein
MKIKGKIINGRNFAIEDDLGRDLYYFICPFTNMLESGDLANEERGTIWIDSVDLLEEIDMFDKLITQEEIIEYLESEFDCSYVGTTEDYNYEDYE